MSEQGLHVVLGASGGTGSAVVEELVRRGHRVRAVNRRGDAEVPAGVERLAADVASSGGAAEACRGAGVVYHCAQPGYTKWAEQFPSLNEAVIGGAATAGAKLVFADNLYSYGPTDGAMTESTPRRATGSKGRVRIALEERLVEAHRSGRLRVTLGRSSDYYGPRGTGTAVGEKLFPAVLKGRPARWLGRLDVPHTLHYLEDIARGLVTLGEQDRADGRVWHLPAAPPLTGRQFLELVTAEAATGSRVARLSPGLVRIAGLAVPVVRELGETLYQWTAPFVSDSSAYELAFGPAEVTPHPEAVARTLARFERRHAPKAA